MVLARVTPATLDVLEALLGPDEELHGLRIAQSAGRKVGSVYPILARLEQAGWVESCWEHEELTRGPRRRFYRLSSDGLGAARELLTARRGTVRQRTAQGSPARSPNPVTEFVFGSRTAR